MYYLIAYAANNLGDDMFIQTLVKRYPNEKFYISCDPRRLRFLNVNNVITPSKFVYALQVARSRLFRNTFGVERSVSKEKEAKAIVRIGGSIFMETNGWKMRRIARKNNNVFIIGANYGPAYTKDFYEAVVNEIKTVNDCCFRDSASVSCFSELTNVRFAPDVLFGYKYYPPACIGVNIGISVIDLSFRDKLVGLQNEYEVTIAEIIQLYNSIGKKVILYSFCSNEGDTSAIERIVKLLNFKPNKTNLEIVEYNGNISVVLNSINTCECVYASRFHAMIIGWCMGKKVMPIIYSNKQISVIEDVNYRGYYWNLLKNEKKSAKVLLKHMNEVPYLDCENLKIDAEKQFMAFDEFIKRHA